MIAKVFHFVENWGMGISKNIELEPRCKFKELAMKFYTVFWRKNIILKSLEKTTQEIISLIKKNPSITRKQLSKIISLSEDGIKYHLDKLRKKDKIRHIGSTKTGHLEVLDGN
jgi:ATP-dependent DNA helicase RecG